MMEQLEIAKIIFYKKCMDRMDFYLNTFKNIDSLVLNNHFNNFKRISNGLMIN